MYLANCNVLLNKLFVGCVCFPDPEDEAVIQELKRLLSKIDEMKVQRQSFLDQLRENLQNDDITNVLVTQNNTPKEVSGNTELVYIFVTWSLKCAVVFNSERERNVLFNDALNTFYLRLYGIRHMVKDHSDSVFNSDDAEGRKEMFYLMTYSTHFIYGYMVSDIW